MLTNIRNVKFCIAIDTMEYTVYHRYLCYILNQTTIAYEQQFPRSSI